MSDSPTERYERRRWEPLGHGSHGEGFGLNSNSRKEPLGVFAFDRHREHPSFTEGWEVE